MKYLNVPKILPVNSRSCTICIKCVLFCQCFSTSRNIFINVRDICKETANQLREYVMQTFDLR